MHPKTVLLLTLASVLSTPAAAQFSDNKVVIGVMGDQSGVVADVGGPGSIRAARMAVADFGGSIDGVPIEIITADHQNKPDVAASIGREWFDRQGVDAIVSGETNGYTSKRATVTPCNGGALGTNSPDRVYEVHAHRDGTLDATILSANFGQSLYIQTDCSKPATQVACANKGVGAGTLESASTS